MTVLLASLREREQLEASRRKAQEEMEQIRAEQTWVEPAGKKSRRKKARPVPSVESIADRAAVGPEAT